MKIITKCLIVLFLLFFFVFADSKESQTPQWKGKIETENGIKAIKNPREPLYGDIKLDLEEELRIGKENDPNELFYIVQDMDIDAAGNIYVVDSKNYRIQKFGGDGKYLRTIGRKGQGPGEFEYPLRIVVDDPGKRIVVVNRYRTLKLFDLTGKFILSIPVKQIFRLKPDEGDTFFAVVTTASGNELTYTHALCKINSKGDVVKTYAEYPYNLYAFKVRGGAATAVLVTNYELSIQLAKLNRNTYVYGYSDKYEINVINDKGMILYKIEKEEPIAKYTDEEKRKFGKYPVPERKPYFFNIIVDSQERIYIQRNNCFGDIEYEKWKKKVDVFSKEGRFLYRTELPPNTRVIRNGLLYCYEMNEDAGMEFVKRYKIKNWDQIRAGI